MKQDFCCLLLGHSIDDLQCHHLELFFSQEREEGVSLEFKSFHPKSNKSFDEQFRNILDAVCAFLNSAGGVLIWGAPLSSETMSNPRNKVCVGELSYINIRNSKEEFSLYKDNLMTKIMDSISPLPGGIEVKVIDNSKKGKIVIIEVQKSIYAPHQHKGVYYMRNDGRTDKAPHFFVEALFRQTRMCNLMGHIRMRKYQLGDRHLSDRDGIKSHDLVVKLAYQIANLTPAINAKNLQVSIFVYPYYYYTTSYGEGMKGEQIFNSLPNQVIFAGSPYRSEIELIFSAEVINKEKKGRIKLIFGTENSQLKLTEYELHFIERGGKYIPRITEVQNNIPLIDLASANAEQLLIDDVDDFAYGKMLGDPNKDLVILS